MLQIIRDIKMQHSMKFIEESKARLAAAINALQALKEIGIECEAKINVTEKFNQLLNEAINKDSSSI